MPVSEKSSSFLEGYGACAQFISRHRNPFDPFTHFQKWTDWHEGWNTRFYGEKIYEGEPNP
jgi:hypothetical protein